MRIRINDSAQVYFKPIYLNTADNTTLIKEKNAILVYPYLFQNDKKAIKYIAHMYKMGCAYYF